MVKMCTFLEMLSNRLHTKKHLHEQVLSNLNGTEGRNRTDTSEETGF